MALLQIHNTKVTPENISLLFSVCDIVVEAFDDAAQKQMLIEYMLVNHPHIPLVAASGMAGFGKREQLVVLKSDNFYICGDSSSEVSEDNPPLAPRVGIVSNMEADVVVEILLNKAVKDEDIAE